MPPIPHTNKPGSCNSIGGHGFGLRPTKFPIAHWPQLVETWLHTIRVVSN